MFDLAGRLSDQLLVHMGPGPDEATRKNCLGVHRAFFCPVLSPPPPGRGEATVTFKIFNLPLGIVMSPRRQHRTRCWPVHAMWVGWWWEGGQGH